MPTDTSVLVAFKPQAHDHGRCVRDSLAAAEEVCAARGLRFTALRRRVLELVLGGHEPVRAYDVLDQLGSERRRAAPPTVYRALEFLLANGLIHRIESLSAYVGCGEPRVPHTGQFLICGVCGSAAELGDLDIAGLVVSKAKRLGFRVQRQSIEAMGVCRACASRARRAGHGK